YCKRKLFNRVAEWFRRIHSRYDSRYSFTRARRWGARVEPVKLIHIVGFKNSGKTTLINNEIQIVARLERKVAVTRHHRDGAKLATPDESKDSVQYLKKGADASIVAGSGHTQHITADEMDYASLKQPALLKKPDVILVEGYKQEP